MQLSLNTACIRFLHESPVFYCVLNGRMDAEFGLCCLQVTSTNVDIAAVALKDDTPQYHLYSPTEVEEVISRL